MSRVASRRRTMSPVASYYRDIMWTDDDHDDDDEYETGSYHVYTPAAAYPAELKTSSGDPLVDLFFNVVPGTKAAEISALLDAAWERDPATTLKLICHIRGVRGSGKADKESFYAAALWLHAAHPKTLAGNVAAFAQFGYFKDLLEILLRILRSGPAPKAPNRRGACRFRGGGNRINSSLTAEENKAQASSAKRKRAAEEASRRYSIDAKYSFLFDCVAEFFASLLKSDVECLKAGEVGKIGLAAKWCPSLGSSYDRATLICGAIAKRVFPREEYRGIADEHYVYRVRNRLRQEVLTPLRKCLELPEVYMSARKWHELPYAHVASVAMKRYGKQFLNHDAARANEFFDDVRRGEANIPCGALLPHEIVKAVRAAKVGDDQIPELQWRNLVAELTKAGKLKNCIAVCGVSSSTQLEDQAISLGLLVSELSEEPWNGRVITFGAEPPVLHKIRGLLLREKVKGLKEAFGSPRYGAYCNLQSVFDQILAVAVDGQLPADKMVRRVYVLSDMNFEAPRYYYYGSRAAAGWDHDAMVNKFQAAGYGEAVPEIVYWNLVGNSSSQQLPCKEGVGLVSGYSKNIVKLFMEADGVLTPQALMNAAISGPDYSNLAVLD